MDQIIALVITLFNIALCLVLQIPDIDELREEELTTQVAAPPRYMLCKSMLLSNLFCLIVTKMLMFFFLM